MGEILGAIIAIDLFVLFVTASLWLMPQQARFTIDASSEIAMVVVPSGQPLPKWGSLKLLPAEEFGKLVSACSDARVTLHESLPKPVRIIFFQVESALLATFEIRDPKGLGTLKCSDGRIFSAPSYMTTRWEDDIQTPVSLTFAGSLQLGAEVPEGVSNARLLRSGILTSQAISWPFRSGKIVTSAPLLMGDKVTIAANDKGTEAMSFGTIRLENGALHIVSQAVGRQALVVRFGQERSEPFVIAPTIIERVQAQAEWALLLLVATLLLNLFGAFLTVATSGSEKR